MTTEHDMAIAMATEIGKQVPVKKVYEDAGSPAARQVGNAIEDIVKVIRLVGFPIQWLAVQQDRYRAFIERAAQSVPEERRMLPAPQILGPILEGIRYEIDDTPIVDMFANLLGAAMDVERASGVFPHFSSVVRTLCPDEAKILKHLKENTICALYPSVGNIHIGYSAGSRYVIENIKLESPALNAMYFDHLFTLGLLTWDQSLQSEKIIDGNKINSMFLVLSPLGRHFMEICLPSTPRPGTP